MLWTPPGAGPFAAIVMAHGCSGLWGRDGGPSARHRDWAERFHALGYVVLHVDSYRPRGVETACATPARERAARATRERPEDIFAALAWLGAQPGIRRDRIGLLGWSNGGETTLWTVRGTRPGAGLAAAVAFYPGCRSARDAAAGWSTRIPLLILNGGDDDWTPPGPCEDLARRARAEGAPVELVVYPGAVHDFDAPSTKRRARGNIATTRSGTATIGTDPAAREDAIRRVTAWFDMHLRL